MFRLILNSFLRSTGARIGLSVLLLAGLVSLLVGRQFLDRQAQNRRDVVKYQRADINRNVGFHPDELGLLLYYQPFALVNETAPLNGLAIGQRDVNPSIERVTIRALEGQKYDADLNNPTQLLLGTIDFSFVLIYLFPLLIIALCYNLISQEQENGTWRLVAVQSQHLPWFVAQLFGARLLVVEGLLLGLLALAVPTLGIPPDGAFWTFVGTSVAYVSVWFAGCFWVVSWQKSSSTNAVVLVTLWLTVLVMLPAALNNYILNRYPVPEAFETTLQQRKGYHEKWDLPKGPTMARFYAHYPQFSRYALPDREFSWLWYYAMQQLGDDESAREAAALYQKLRQRDQFSHRIARFIPPLHTQLTLNDLAQSGLDNHLRFLEATTRFHEKWRLHFYPKIFSEASVASENWKAISVESFSSGTTLHTLNQWLPLVLFVLLFTGAGWLMLKRTL